MNIVAALKQTEKSLQHQLRAVQNALAALTVLPHGVRHAIEPYQKPFRRKRTLSAAARTKISQAAKARWARLRAEKSKK
jgi:hypothetical protein